jgi:hypothetical protein
VEVVDDRGLSKKAYGLVGERLGSQVRLEDENEVCLGAFFVAQPENFNAGVHLAKLKFQKVWL